MPRETRLLHFRNGVFLLNVLFNGETVRCIELEHAKLADYTQNGNSKYRVFGDRASNFFMITEFFS